MTKKDLTLQYTAIVLIVGITACSFGFVAYGMGEVQTTSQYKYNYTNNDILSQFKIIGKKAVEIPEEYRIIESNRYALVGYHYSTHYNNTRMLYRRTISTHGWVYKVRDEKSKKHYKLYASSQWRFNIGDKIIVRCDFNGDTILVNRI